MKKILTVMGIIAVLFVSVQYAEAETLSISASNERGNISIPIDGNENIKFFKTGFLLKNTETGTIVFGHVFGDHYKLTVNTVQGWTNFISDKIKTDNVIFFSEKIEPKSSTGADISKYDIPTQGRTDHTPYTKPNKIHNPDSLDMIPSVPKQVSYKHNFNFDFTAIDTQIINKNDQKMDDVSVSSIIFNPIGGIMGIWNGTTNNSGVFGDKYYIVDNQMLGEYKIETTMEKDNYTPITKMVSFFVLPSEDSGSSRKCPPGYMINSTNQCTQELN